MESLDTEENHYNCRRTCSQLYDAKWDNDWKDILPKAPEKPSDETGVWRLIDDASDWKDISENVAKIPKLRQQHCCYPNAKKSDKKRYRDDIKKLLLLYKKKGTRDLIKPSERTNSLMKEKRIKIMVDKSVQTDDEDDHGLFIVVI